MSYTTIQISKETYELLHRLQNDLKKIMRKKSISMDLILKLLIYLKIDVADLLAELDGFLKCMEKEKHGKT